MIRTLCRIPVAAVTIAGLGLAGCAHVKPQEMQTELASLRAELRDEYQAADAELAGRIDAVDHRVTTLDGDLREVDARTARLQSDLQALAVEFQGTVERLEEAIAFNAPVYFDYDSDVLREQDRPVLQRFAAVVQSYYPESLITIEGFTDPAGSAAYNLALGERRAEAVKSFLVQEGVADMRVRTVSYGKAPERQVVPGAQGPGQAGLPNRRVALVIDTVGADWDIVANAAADGSGS